MPNYIWQLFYKVTELLNNKIICIFRRNAFPGLCSRENKRPYPSNARKPKASASHARRLIPFVPKETWTHDVCVRSSTNQLFIPDREESYSLLQAGIGRRKLVCPN